MKLYQRERHQKIAYVLNCLDRDLFMKHECFFGGGTAIVLKNNEYRESIDIDFMISNLQGYRELRSLATDPGGLVNLFTDTEQLGLTSEVRADQYGIRSRVLVQELSIKFEIILEGRIEFDPPGQNDQIEGVMTLTNLDFVTSKLLAHSDRWRDVSVFSRDLIDLAMMEFTETTWCLAMEKAQSAYGASIQKDLSKSIEFVLSDPVYLKRCIEILRMQVYPAVLAQKFIRLRKLAH